MSTKKYTMIEDQDYINEIRNRKNMLECNIHFVTPLMVRFFERMKSNIEKAEMDFIKIMHNIDIGTIVFVPHNGKKYKVTEIIPDCIRNQPRLKGHLQNKSGKYNKNVHFIDDGWEVVLTDDALLNRKCSYDLYDGLLVESDAEKE